MWPMFGNIPPMYSLGQPTTNSNTINFTGGPWTFTRTAQSGSETIATFKVSDDAANYIAFINGSGTDSRYDPFIRGVVSSTQSALILQGLCGSDSGSAAAIAFDVRTGGGATLSNKTLFGLLNNNTTVFSIIPINSGANGAVTWGTQTGAAPAFTTRSAGTRLVLLSNIGASTVDYGIGYESSHVWFSCEAAQNARGFKWYAGTTLTARLSGDGILSLGTNTTNYARLGQKLETNTSANYGGAALNVWSTTASEAALFDLNRSKSATIGTHTIVANGDALGYITGRGSDGTGFIPAAAIQMHVDGTPGTNDMPGRLTLWTTADGAANPTERMRITNAGDVGVGKTPTTGIMLDLNGVLGLKSYTVGTLPSASTQAGGTVYVSDAAGSPCIALSNGTNWKRCDDCTVTVS